MSVDSATHALSLQEATRNSTSTWQKDLAALFQHAKERFPDVVWELTGEDTSVEEVWGHKAIVYARAPPSFQSRYFSFRPQENRNSPLAASALSLDIPRGSRSPSPSPFRTASPAPSTTVGGLTRLTTSINPALFSNELEYLYTGQGFGEAFEFLFDEQGGEDNSADDAEELRIDKLRKDLVFMWRSRLYSDVRIALTSNAPPAPSDDDDDAHDRQMPVFSSHRFILASRSPYFHTALVSWPSPSKPLSSSISSVQARVVSEMAHGLFHAALPFTAYEALTQGAWRAGGCTCRKCAARVPRILEFALRPDVQDAVLERGARRALVGLFGTGWCTPEFAALPPKLHSSALKGLAKRTTPANALAILWAAEGARARLAPLVDAWADTVRPLIDAGRGQVDAVLGAQTAEVLAEADWNAIMRVDGVRFEDGERVEWAMRSVVRGVSEANAGRVYQALVNVLLLPHPEPTEEGTFPAQPLLSQTSHVRVQVEQARMDVLQWIKRGGRGRADRVAREGGLDGVEAWAVREISDFLEIPVDDLLAAIPPTPGQHHRQPTSTSRKSTALLSAKDADQHSLSIHTQQSSMRVSVLSRSIPTPRGARSVRQQEVAEKGVEEAAEDAEKDDDGEAGERPDSKLTPELSAGLFRSLEAGASSPLKGKGRVNSNGSGNDHGSGSTNDSAPPSPTTHKPPVPTRALPGSPASPSTPIASGATTPKYARSTVSVSVSPAPRPRSAASSRTSTSTTTTTTGKPPSRPGSVASTSTVRTTRLRPPPVNAGAGGRRASGASTSASASVSEFRTALSGTASTASRSRQSSVSSVASRGPARSRKTSGASDVSVRTTGAGGSGAGAKPPVPALDPAVRRRGTPSTRSVRSVASSTSTMDTAASAARKATLAVGREKRPETKVIKLKQRGPGTGGAGAKDKEKEVEKPKPAVEKEVGEKEPEKEKDHRKTESMASTASTASASTLRVKRKGSGDTVSTVTTKAGPSASAAPSTRKPAAKPKTVAPPKRPAPAPAAPSTLKDLPLSPRGAMLEIGIPCIISSKRKRFKAFARYIGEVEGEAGPWVGVEVPAAAADGMGAGSAGGRQWHDGSWGGIRYFEIGGAGSEWEYGDEGRDRATRRRRLEGSGTSGYGFGSQKGVKREGESLGGLRGAKRIRSASPAVSDVDGAGESRGLFVRPSAVLYVVDAVGADL
ncbi:hypothetical protein B0H19DRAFT_1148514 [Mycena capillaripes]|nr:hypothetical protein B0H19DRAFT_1148514 [Mycena capillaripes]